MLLGLPLYNGLLSVTIGFGVAVKYMGVLFNCRVFNPFPVIMAVYSGTDWAKPTAGSKNDRPTNA
jgi:hypothetical protein